MIIFIVLPLAAMAYVLWHIWQLLPMARAWRWTVVGVAVGIFIVMLLNFMGLTEYVPLRMATFLYETGNSFIFILLYLVMAFLVLDALSITHIMPLSWLHNNGYLAITLTLFMVMLFSYGNLQYSSLNRQTLYMPTMKNIVDDTKGKHSIKIALLSDLHLGYHIGRKELARWVDFINKDHPDLILVGGDIIDISVRPLLEEGMAEEFKRLKAPVYACLGNHEYYSGEPRAEKFYREAGITLLRDSVAYVENVAIIGRDDRTNQHRMPLHQLTAHVKNGCFTILLDHQPYNLEEAEREGIDFQFSGHTHHGQVWPVSWITEAMYECAFGVLKKGHTQYYISSGIGIWGGKFRLGTRSEYVVLNVNQHSRTYDHRLRWIR